MEARSTGMAGEMNTLTGSSAVEAMTVKNATLEGEGPRPTALMVEAVQR
jgi:hypothetical protein